MSTPTAILKEVIATSKGRVFHRQDDCPSQRVETFTATRPGSGDEPAEQFETVRCIDCGLQVTRSLDNPKADPIVA